MLLGAFLWTLSIANTAQAYQHRYRAYQDLAARDQLTFPNPVVTPCNDHECVVAAPHLPCNAANGTELTSAKNNKWTMLCDIDFLAQDIYPFFLSRSFEACLSRCEEHNAARGDQICAGFVFAPDRVNLDNDCYLKSSLNNVVYPATIHLIGATLHRSVPSATAYIPPEATSSPSIIVLPPAASDGTMTKNRNPSVNKSSMLGVSVNTPTSQYVSHAPAKPYKMATTNLKPGINIELITKYPLAADTGSWTSSSTHLAQNLSDLSIAPRLSRDGGRGGMVNGTHIFIFCDTSTYGEEKDATLGYLNSFVSSSVAVDRDMYGLKGKALSLTDPIGQWQDDVGRLRGWIPMTTGEQAFNYAISGQGYRYAVWPESSPILINKTHALVYAALVYLDVDMETQSRPNFTNLGNTLVVITIDPSLGPHADRLVNQFFTEDEVPWGTLGGFRAWGFNGNTSSDGDIYVFGQVEKGVLVGRVSAHDFVDRSKYTYWNGKTWSPDMPPRSASSDALMIAQPVMDLDVIYSPYHDTFIMIYLTPEADNTFYYRYLLGADGSQLHIIAANELGGDPKYVEQIVHNQWSEQRILFNVPPPERGYIYAGGLHAGYFGAEDITEGGTKMLCTWTEHTKIDPDKPESGYAHKAMVVELDW